MSKKKTKFVNYALLVNRWVEKEKWNLQCDEECLTRELLVFHEIKPLPTPCHFFHSLYTYLFTHLHVICSIMQDPATYSRCASIKASPSTAHITIQNVTNYGLVELSLLLARQPFMYTDLWNAHRRKGCF